MGLANSLRSLDDGELEALLAARADLLQPPPRSFDELANRASTQHSLQRCVDGLNRFQRQLLEALIYLESVSTTEDIASLDASGIARGTVSDEMAGLRRLGLVAGDDRNGWALVRAVRQTMPTPFGLGPKVASALDSRSHGELQSFAARHGVKLVNPKQRLIADLTAKITDKDRVMDVVARADQPKRDLLAAIHDGGSIVRISTPLYDTARLSPDIRYWLDNAIVFPSGWDVVMLPREIGMLLRGGSPLRSFQSTPPAVRAASGRPTRDTYVELTPPQLVDAVATLLAAWGDTPPATLQTGGMGVREVKSVTRRLDVSERTASRLIELIGATQLVSVEWAHNRVVPTPTADDWLNRSPLDRWLMLIDDWRLTPHHLSRAGTRDHADKVVAPLSREYADPEWVWRRATIVNALLSHDAAGAKRAIANATAVSAMTTVAPDDDSVAARVLWAAPGRWSGRSFAPDQVARLVGEIVDELALLGLTRAGAVTDIGRAVLSGNVDDASRRAAALFPDPVDVFTVGADLTALAPAELRASIRTTLDVMADVESRGAATMYRFTEASMRRAVDRGHTAETMMSFLDAHARPTTPQALRYLVEDVARRFGSVRVGAAVSYVRCDDAALLAEIVRAKKTAKANLRLIAPTVAVSHVPPGKVLDALRDGGFLPAMEDDGGILIVKDTKAQRTKRIPQHLAHGTAHASQVRRLWDEGLAAASSAAPSSVAPTPDAALAAVRQLRKS